jgi:type VI protein secretion system component VasF
VKRLVCRWALVALLGAGWGVASAEQDVRPIIPRGEQEIEQMGQRGDQVVQGFGAPAEQQVERYVEPSQASKRANAASKVVTGVAAAAVSAGAMAAMLLFL